MSKPEFNQAVKAAIRNLLEQGQECTRDAILQELPKIISARATTLSYMLGQMTDQEKTETGFAEHLVPTSRKRSVPPLRSPRL